MPEGESGVQRGNLTEARQEALAEYWGTPEKERDRTPETIGELLGISTATVRRAKKDPRIRKLISEALNEQLVYDVIEARAVAKRILLSEKERGDTRLKAWRTLEQMAGNLSQTGPTINVTNDFSTYGEMPLEEIVNRLKEFKGGEGLESD